MILRLKGADFSGNNIGTLSTWRIYKTLKGFTTESTINSVDKDGSYSATFTVIDGYMFSAASVMMGDTDITSSLVWNDSNTEATLTISKVTANVQINIMAVSSSGNYIVNYNYTQLGSMDVPQNGTSVSVSAGTVITEADAPVIAGYYYQSMWIDGGTTKVTSVTVTENVNITFMYAKILDLSGATYKEGYYYPDRATTFVANSEYNCISGILVESGATYTILKGSASIINHWIGNSEGSGGQHCIIEPDVSSAHPKFIICDVAAAISDLQISIPSTLTRDDLLIVKGEAVLNNLDSADGGEDTTYTVIYMYNCNDMGDVQASTTRTVAAGTVITEADAPIVDGYTYSHMSVLGGSGAVTSVTITENTTIFWIYTENDTGGEDITDQFTWTEGGPLLFATGGVGGFGIGANFMYSDFVDISAYTALNMTICARTNTTATGGWAFYTTNELSGFISTGASSNNGNGASVEGSETRLITIPEGAKYIRTTYWNAYLPHQYATSTPFSCIAIK